MRARFPSLTVRALVAGTLLSAGALAPALAGGGHRTTGHQHLTSSGRDPHQDTWSKARIKARLEKRLKAAPASYKVAPGVRYREWTMNDGSGPQRIHLLDVNTKIPGVSLDYQANALLRDRTPASRILANDPTAVGGVNANFFDISDTGAPNGVGQNRARGLLHAPAFGWNNAFYQTTDGAYHVGELDLVAQLNEYPTISVTGLNTPNVKQDSTTVFTPSWGDSAGESVMNGPHGAVRELSVQNGVVVSNSPTLSSGVPVTGLLLVARGVAASQLATIPVGSPLSVSWTLSQPTLMAVTGNQLLLSAGQNVAPDDGISAPRTAIGIDPTNGHVLIVAADGRMESAAGMRLPALANLLAGLGATDALNFDGGGSSTMIARSYRWASYPSLVNLPSEGSLRDLPDTLSVDYTPPVGG